MVGHYVTHSFEESPCKVFGKNCEPSDGMITATTTTAASINPALHQRDQLSSSPTSMLFTDPVAAALIAGSSRWSAGSRDISSSSPRAMTKSIRRLTSTRKTSRSATTCAARSYLHVIWAAVAARAVVRADALRHLPAARGYRGVHAPRGHDLAGSRRRRLLFRTVQLFFPEGRADRPRVADQDHHRPVQRREALLARRRFI
jgi:hypothetical protein